ncbi:MAG: hypothetical protein LLG01_03525, partial [Planctomycetaceae bacterium]|nr:hypothetical protein [Planctomycetaceae bacterium]
AAPPAKAAIRIRQPIPTTNLAISMIAALLLLDVVFPASAGLLCPSRLVTPVAVGGSGHGRIKFGWYGKPTIQLDLLTVGMVPSTLTTTLRPCLALLLLPLHIPIPLQWDAPSTA